jgi:hypothetical protein
MTDEHAGKGEGQRETVAVYVVLKIRERLLRLRHHRGRLRLLGDD